MSPSLTPSRASQLASTAASRLAIVVLEMNAPGASHTAKALSFQAEIVSASKTGAPEITPS
jgi:hypothetical protein